MKNIISFCLIIMVSVNLFSQDNVVLQLSGIIQDDSLKALSYAHIINLNKKQGTISNFNGLFSFVVQNTDTILFSSLGYKPRLYIVPDTAELKEMYITINLEKDTIMLKSVDIFPYATFKQFKEAFLTLDIPDDEIARALKNMNLIKKQTISESKYSYPGASYNTYMNQQYSLLYTRGQYPINNLLNPFAWAKFVEAIKNGDFRKKEEE